MRKHKKYFKEHAKKDQQPDARSFEGYVQETLFKASRNDDIMSIHKAIKGGADINYTRPSDGFTSLMVSVANNNLSSVYKLLREKADPNIVSPKLGITAISIALKSADFHPQIIEALLYYGAKTTYEEIENYNNLYATRTHIFEDIIEYDSYRDNIEVSVPIFYTAKSSVSSEDKTNESTEDYNKPALGYRRGPEYAYSKELIINSSSSSSGDDESLNDLGIKRENQSDQSLFDEQTKEFKYALNCNEELSDVIAKCRIFAIFNKSTEDQLISDILKDFSDPKDDQAYDSLKITGAKNSLDSAW